MTTLVIASQKGGVGKTTVAINLSYSMALRGQKVLLVDTDPQGSVGLSLSRGVRERLGFYDALFGSEKVEKLVLPTRLPEFKLLTSGRAEAFTIDYSLDEFTEQTRITNIFGDLEDIGSELIIVDTPAGVGGITSAVLAQANSVMIPQQAEPLGVRSVPQVLKAIAAIRKNGAQLGVAGIVMTMTDPRQRESVEAESQLRSALPSGIMCQTSIPRDSVFLRASGLGVPVGLLSHNPVPAAIAFDQLAAELEGKLGLSNIKEQNHGIERLLD